jgi:hypothetical protein
LCRTIFTQPEIFNMMTFKMVASAAAITLFMCSTAFAQTPRQGRVDANGMPTNHSTPAEKAETADINRQIGVSNAAVDAQTNTNNADYQAKQRQYQGQVQQYQGQVQQNQAQQQDYQDRSAAYNGLRERYGAERSAYRRGAWPSRNMARWSTMERDDRLVGERVQLVNGRTVGTVVSLAHGTGGTVSALMVKLDNDKMVWIDASDVRHNRADGVVMTNLDRGDLRRMADERR